MNSSHFNITKDKQDDVLVNHSEPQVITKRRKLTMSKISAEPVSNDRVIQQHIPLPNGKQDRAQHGDDDVDKSSDRGHEETISDLGITSAVPPEDAIPEKKTETNVDVLVGTKLDEAIAQPTQNVENINDEGQTAESVTDQSHDEVTMDHPQNSTPQNAWSNDTSNISHDPESSRDFYVTSANESQEKFSEKDRCQDGVVEKVPVQVEEEPVLQIELVEGEPSTRLYCLHSILDKN